MDQIEPLARSMPYMTAIGNHERDWPGSGDRFPSMYDSGGECGVPTERHFSMPGPAEDKPWYSFDYGPIHFTIYSTEHRFHPGSEQHEFIREDLAAVDRSITPWLVVGGHRPFYIDSTSTHAPDGDQPVADDLRSALEDLFLRFSVDLTWQRAPPQLPTHLPSVSEQLSGTSWRWLGDCPHPPEANATHFTCEMVEDLQGFVMDSFVLRKPLDWRPRDPETYHNWRP
ncbi:hypothetical protein WJX84_011864, partial [Apatococcus fuscideae]